jgi:uncharacterized protein YaiE (UPF0345 family)
MATLTNTKIKDTYDGLLKTTDNEALDVSGVTLIEDGLGNASAISIGRANNGVTITGALGIGTSNPSAAFSIDAVKPIRAENFTLRSNSTAPAEAAFIYRPVTGVLGFGTANTERMRIDSSGRVGIGLTPSMRFQVKSSGNTTEDVASFGNANISDGLVVTTNGNLDWGLNARNSRNLTFSTNQSERMRIDSSGRLGIGTSSPASILEISKNDQTNGATLSITNSFIGSGWASGDTVGTINFRIDDTSTSEPVRGQIKLFDDASPGSTYPANNAMSFSTANANTLTERMRISSTGAVFMPYLTGSSGYNDLAYNTANGQLIYRTSSLRYKENVQDLPSALDKVNNLRTVTYDEKETGRSYFGLIAEELYEHIPELVTMKEIEGFNEPQPDGITYSMLSVYLLKAMQEQQEIINDLKARIETLEAK